jgi:hypothetical protein
MATAVKRLLVGRALKTEQASHERLTRKTALAVFSSDALSSTAYATEEILLVLAVAAGATSGGSFSYVIPVSVGIAVLLAIVAISYRQTIHAYPSGGGAYIVAKENLGTTPGLIAGASLLVDYVLTVSVSIAAGVAAITSAVQGTHYAWLNDHKVTLSCLHRVHCNREPARRARVGRALRHTHVRFRREFPVHDRVRFVSLLRLRRRRRGSVSGRVEDC